ncbi:MAG: sodium-dependent transporter [Bacteroidales bacterium]
MSNLDRDSFSSRFGVLVAVAGSAVGLGNLWRFPYLVGNNGGAAFIIIYLLFVIVLCLPIMVSEFVIGRRGRANSFGAIEKLAPRSGWLSIGVISVVASFTIMAFYSVVGGWTIYYIFKSFSNTLFVNDSQNLTLQFSAFIESPYLPTLSHLLFLALSSLIVVAGVKNGIEKYSKLLMPLLFLLVVIVAIRSLTLEGSAKGVEFLFRPDFSKVTGKTLLDALGQAFFSLSLGMGCMITYSSYVKKEENLFKISIMGAGADTIFALIAGLAIVPAVFAFGISPSEGPSLVFITLPQVFAQIPFGRVISILFFIILLIAAVTSAISLIEVVTAFLTEELNWSRKKAVATIFVALGFIGALSSLSMGALPSLTIFGKNLFDLFDFISSNILLPLGGALVVLFVGWRLNGAELYDELSNGATIKFDRRLFRVFLFVIKYVAPLAILIVLLANFLA